MELYGYKQIKSIKDFIDLIPPRHYKAGFSAYEIAHSWKSSSKFFPDAINEVFRTCNIPIFANLRPDYVVAEYPVFLDDTFHTPSKSDIFAFCSNFYGDRIVMAVEGKCLEPFGPRIQDWIVTSDFPTARRQKMLFPESPPIQPRKKRRLEFLNSLLPTKIAEDSCLRYQAVHRSASAIIEASKTSSIAAVVVIQAFRKSLDNYFDYSDWLDFLGLHGCRKNKIIGPVLLGRAKDIPTYFVYVQDQISSERPTLFKI